MSVLPAPERSAGDDRVPYPDDVAAAYRDAGLWGTRTIADEFQSLIHI